MTAAVLRRTASERGLRPVDPRRDMSGMAQLIEVAFAERLDDSGRAMVRAMRGFGRWGWLGWAAGHLFLPPAAFPQGYVWLESGRLVGNASLMRADPASDRWVLINVAVEPAWRRRGIARSMVQACLEDARRRGGRELLLQVDAANAGARDLYRQLGFQLTSVRTSWEYRTARRAKPEGEAPARRRRPGEASDQWALAQRLCPEGLLWPRPVDRDIFRGTFGWAPGSHWVWPAVGPIEAFLSAFPGFEGAGVYFILIAGPSARGRAEGPLLDLALTDLPARPGGIRLETLGAIEQAIPQARGFERGRELAWMSIQLAGSLATAATSEDWGSP